MHAIQNFIHKYSNVSKVMNIFLWILFRFLTPFWCRLPLYIQYIKTVSNFKMFISQRLLNIFPYNKLCFYSFNIFFQIKTLKIKFDSYCLKRKLCTRLVFGVLYVVKSSMWIPKSKATNNLWKSVSKQYTGDLLCPQ